MKEFLLWIWQLPQNLLGLFLLLWYKKEKIYHRLNGRTFYFTPEMPSGISLGNYIIMNREDWKEGMKHEYGHTVDSRRFGPLYLILIGLPSITWNMLDRVFLKKKKFSERAKIYYNMPWEKSADRNGRVDRKAYIENFRKLGY